jgi:peptidyl-prolyl cis-trans isomerase D
MLGLMRKHAKSWLIKVALFAIVIVFIFWGGYSYTERKATRVAVVNGSFIGLDEYQRTYSNLVEEMRRRYGERFSSELAEALQLKQQALDRLVNRRLLLAAADRLELEVTQEELQDAIIAYPAFQTNGRFDPRRYQRTLGYLRLTPQEFEASQYEDLLIDKVKRCVARGAKLLETEVRSFYHHTRDEVNLDYLHIEPEDFTHQVEVNEEDVRGYFDEHLEAYRLPSRRNIAYVRFAPEEYFHEVAPTEAEVDAFYRMHQSEYRQPRKVRARHILFRLPKQASSSKLQDITQKAKEVLVLARKGDDFAALARAYSEDATAAEGGDLGYFSRKDMVKPFADAAFALNEGEISDLVRTRFGVHIIKVEDIQEAVTRPLSEVQEAVLQSIKRERAAEIASRRAEALSDEAHALDDLRKAAAVQDLNARESGFFAANQAIPGLGRHPEVNEILFSLEPKEISPVLSVGDDEVVAQLVESQESRLPELGEVKEDVRRDLVAARSKLLARQQAEEWLASARREKDLGGVARRNGRELQETGLFASPSPPAVLRNQRDALVAAFALTAEHPVAPDVYEVKDGFMLLQLQARKEAPEDQFQQEKDRLTSRLLRTKKELAFQRWLTGRREHAEIKILQQL